MFSSLTKLYLANTHTNYTEYNKKREKSFKKNPPNHFQPTKIPKKNVEIKFPSLKMENFIIHTNADTQLIIGFVIEQYTREFLFYFFPHSNSHFQTDFSLFSSSSFFLWRMKNNIKNIAFNSIVLLLKQDNGNDRLTRNHAKNLFWRKGKVKIKNLIDSIRISYTWFNDNLALSVLYQSLMMELFGKDI